MGLEEIGFSLPVCHYLGFQTTYLFGRQTPRLAWRLKSLHTGQHWATFSILFSKFTKITAPVVNFNANFSILRMSFDQNAKVKTTSHVVLSSFIFAILKD